ncbi:MAG: hypothetical protein KBS69_01580, partial [Bacteroidales bacterium]|nr:hypothetical protein [Candidatus Colicola caccequi]
MRKQILAFCLLSALVAAAQPVNTMDYKRNSLANMLVYHPEDEFGPNIYEAYLAMPLPDKYDDHNLTWRIINNNDVTGVQYNKSGLYKAKYGHVLSSSEMKKNAAYIENLLNQHQIGKLLVAKWFNLQGDSVHTATFNTELIQQRGQYNAS